MPRASQDIHLLLASPVTVEHQASQVILQLQATAATPVRQVTQVTRLLLAILATRDPWVLQDTAVTVDLSVRADSQATALRLATLVTHLLQVTRAIPDL